MSGTIKLPSKWQGVIEQKGTFFLHKTENSNYGNQAFKLNPKIMYYFLLPISDQASTLKYEVLKCFVQIDKDLQNFLNFYEQLFTSCKKYT